MTTTKLGDMNIYVAAPATSPTAAVIVIPEIFGLNEGIRRKCSGWAAKGYLAVALDIFWRFAPGVELNPDVEAEMNEALPGDQFTSDQIEAELKAAKAVLVIWTPTSVTSRARTSPR